MRFGVETEQLAATATAVRADGQRVASQRGLLTVAGNATPSWAPGRAGRATLALFDTLAAAARQAGEGLDELGNRVGAAAGEYDGVEHRILRDG